MQWQWHYHSPYVTLEYLVSMAISLLSLTKFISFIHAFCFWFLITVDDKIKVELYSVNYNPMKNDYKTIFVFQIFHTSHNNNTKIKKKLIKYGYQLKCVAGCSLKQSTEIVHAFELNSKLNQITNKMKVAKWKKKTKLWIEKKK